MSDKPQGSFAKMLRDIDDADLDVYEFRLWCHIWRVGVSWESVRTMAKKCGMSTGRAYKAKESLLERNFLAYEERNGRLGLSAVVCSPHEQTQQFSVHQVNECNDVPVADVHVVNEGVHHVNASVHHVNAILSMPLEESLLKGEGDRANGRVGAASPPPPVVIVQPADRTPGGNGYHPPQEPEPERRPPSEEKFDKAVMEDMAAAITEVTGVDYKLNWTDKDGKGVGDMAWGLLSAGYTADQVRRHYSQQRTAGAWNWFDQDWRGKKGEPPSVKAIRETIAGATQVAASPKKVGQIERALAMFGNAPKPATQGG